MRTYFGPNPHASDPVVVSQVDWGAIDEATALRVRGELEAAYPNWLNDCPTGPAGAPDQAMALLTAHWARALLNSVRGFVETAGAGRDDGGRCVLWVGYHVPQLTVRAIELAVHAVRAAFMRRRPFPDPAFAQAVEALRRTCRTAHPDYVARVLMVGARSAGVPFLRSPLGDRNWQYGWGCRSRVFLEASPLQDSRRGAAIASHKALSTRYLLAMGWPATCHLLARTVDEARAHAKSLGWPLVVKPSDAGKGRGVTVGIRSDEALAQAFEAARAMSAAPILVERFVEGADHRLLVIRGRLVAATRREPATVVGNGVCTVRALMQALNALRRSEPHLARYLKQVSEEPAVLQHLASQGLDPSSIPAMGQRVTLRGNANVSTGGTPTDVMASVHPEVRALAESIAVNLGIESLGVDYITTDISRPWREVPGCVVEVNAMPGLDLHVAAGMSEADIGRVVLGPDVGRVPVAVVVADAADQRQLLDALAHRGVLERPGVAVLGPDGSRIAGLRLDGNERPYPARVAQLLANRQTGCALLAVEPAWVERAGLPVDASDLAVLQASGANAEVTAQLLRRHATAFIDARADAHWPAPAIVDQIDSLLRSAGGVAR